ncbi:hypothetical protein BGZ46_008174 [Entomortierella lignicola]|nr:hypothetical protein BGZ46_008174 [Entomortierella lignicola]
MSISGVTTSNTPDTSESNPTLANINTTKQFRLRVLAGPGSDYKDLCPLNVNDDANPLLIETDEIVCKITFRVKGLNQVPGYEQGQQEDGLECVGESEWFNHSGSDSKGKNNNLSCLQIALRFKREWTGDQLMFGTVLDEPIKRLSSFASVGVKILHYLDPGIRTDFSCERPYILSPLIVSMNKVHVTSTRDKPTSDGSKGQNLEWPSPNGEHVIEDTRLLFNTPSASQERLDSFENDGTDLSDKRLTINDSAKSNTIQKPLTSRERQHYFAKPENLAKHKFRTDHEYAFEFLGPGSYVDFARFKVKFAGFSIDAIKSWEGQPYKFMLRSSDASITFFTLWIEPALVYKH